MTCHMVEVENNLGRSLVIDLGTKSPNKFRQVDHRSIDYIIFQNVKYVLKKGAKAQDEDDRKKDEPKWDAKQLSIGDWFSGTSYYRAVEEKGDSVICRSEGKSIEISRDILQYEMHNSSVFGEEQKLPLTQVATKMAQANSKCFTVCFTTKVDEKMVQEKLKKIRNKLSADKAKALAKELLVGEEKVMTARLSRAEGKLGRSLVIDLPTQGYRQVDHRTLRWFISDNIKYTVKK